MRLLAACAVRPENFSGRNGAILPAITNQSAFDPSTLSDFVFGRIYPFARWNDLTFST
jgi:hypothetical protein